jgi:hypothetical protein
MRKDGGDCVSGEWGTYERGVGRDAAAVLQDGGVLGR